MTDQEHATPTSNPLADVAPILSLKETAALLKTTRRNISRYIASGELRAAKLHPGRAGKVLIYRDAIAAFLAERTA